MIPSITTVPLAQLASGDVLSLQLYRFSGAQAGKKAYIQANLHGSEICGNAVIHQLIHWLTTLADTQLVGEVWLVPVCNPFSTNQRGHHFSTGRFNAYDGKNWNRIFWDYEKDDSDITAFAQLHMNLEPETIQHHYRQQIQTSFAKLADKIQAPSSVSLADRYRYHLQQLYLDADYVMDLHSSSNQGLDYLYYFPQREDSARSFGLELAVLLDEYDGDTFDEAFIKPWLALETCLAELGRNIRFEVEAWTLELGSAMQMKPDSVAKGVRGVQHYLQAKGMVQGLDALPSALPEMRFSTSSQMQDYFAPVGGMIQSRVPLGTIVQAGQPLYQLLNFNRQSQLPTQIEVTAEADSLVFDVSINHAVNTGEYVLATLPID